ncbi:hypothetical protein [Brucella oryzae]|uniref:hypothetical protein n=1 Tax=Brucella oryzae TaxID=335286 RepID=UPI001FDF07DB|nr:hypothetical protein [Brucella oryzae]
MISAASAARVQDAAAICGKQNSPIKRSKAKDFATTTPLEPITFDDHLTDKSCRGASISEFSRLESNTSSGFISDTSAANANRK